MTSTMIRMRRLIAGLLVLWLVTSAASIVFAQQKQYVTTTLRGRLTEAKGKPVAGALLRFTPEDPTASVVEAETDVAGAFEASGLVFTNYDIEIVAPNGDVIRGVNQLPVTEDGRAEYELVVSPRVVSETTLQNQPQRVVAVVSVERGKWKKFWAQFGIYVGAAAAVGAVAEN
ncbi:MAG: carboxypeptidase regulatory-like domain-containing protein [bacterium]|nr:carboxypeptidase regulatory-like domain-containing protein [bacterium]